MDLEVAYLREAAPVHEKLLKAFLKFGGIINLLFPKSEIMKPLKRVLAALSMSVLILPAHQWARAQVDWPRKIEKEDITVVIYQPQIESLTDNRMEARAAVSVTSREYTTPVFGAMWFDCKISTDRDERTVLLTDVSVTAARFPDVEEEKIRKLSDALEKEIPKWEMELSLDQLLADLDISETPVGSSPDLDNNAPEIIFTTVPSVLIMVDGDPIFQEIEDSPYERVVNTPFFIVKDKKKGIYYINGGNHWYTSGNAADWEYTEKIPGKLEQIAQEALDTGEDGYASEEALSQQEGGEEDVIPELILRTTPAELLQSDGEPDFAPIKGTSILYMTNTADDILMDIGTQEYFILVAGRWYRSRSLTNGPWTFVEPDQVPEGFADIPAESDMGSVRASVAGTQEAREAVLENQIPQTAEVDRKEAKLEVSYDGSPRFEPVGKTDMKYAVNTDKSVLLIGGRYYCCDDAIWFESGSATGPWIVSTRVPDEVQEIPPESPVYNVKYVYIYDYTPSVVYVGYTPGYVNSYVYRGCVYYGTGYYYRPWYGVYYYPRPVTYGFSVHWNPYTGWGFSYSVSFGWMTIGWGSPYHGWWGPAGYRSGYHYGYHHGYSHGYRAGYFAGQRAAQGPTPYGSRQLASNNVYRNRSQGISQTGNVRYDPKNGNRLASADRATRPSAQPANRDNNIYTDRDGNVYRRDGDSWSRVENRAGTPAAGETRPSTRETRPSTTERPSTGQQPATRESRPSTTQRPSTGQQPSARTTRPDSAPGSSLNRDYQSRSRGEQRTQQFNQNRNDYQYSRPSPSRPSGTRPAPSRAPAGRRR
jgi:hypothetical protein